MEIIIESTEDSNQDEKHAKDIKLEYGDNYDTGNGVSIYYGKKHLGWYNANTLKESLETVIRIIQVNRQKSREEGKTDKINK